MTAVGRGYGVVGEGGIAGIVVGDGDGATEGAGERGARERSRGRLSDGGECAENRERTAESWEQTSTASTGRMQTGVEEGRRNVKWSVRVEGKWRGNVDVEWTLSMSPEPSKFEYTCECSNPSHPQCRSVSVSVSVSVSA
jgi:hypothetical protein